MDFDGRLIKGEKAKGSVYLFQRAQRQLPPLLKLERDGLNRIVYPVLRRNADPALTPSAVGAPADPTAVQQPNDTQQTKPAAKKKKKARKKKRSWRRSNRAKRAKKK